MHLEKHSILKQKTLLVAFISCFFINQSVFAKPATKITEEANESVYKQLPFGDKQDFKDAEQGLLRKPSTLTIKDKNGNVIWDLESYKKFITLDAKSPISVNPSLWRNSQLNMQYGLFKVTDRIYQVRGYDMANVTFIRGDTGWIVFDVGTNIETARAAYDLVSEEFGKLPIVAVLYSHPHVDHYGGIKGVISEEDVKSNKVKLIAPVGFMEHAVSEGVISGNAMSRRAIYMYGAFLPRNEEGNVGIGLGMTNPLGVVSIIEPNHLIEKTGEKVTIDGVEMIFQLTPGTEAPVEMNAYFPQFKAMWMAENTTNVMHNIVSLRGTQVRDALKWAEYINETIELYGDNIEVKFQSHHWPIWQNKRIIEYLEKQRDLYKYIHDQSVYLMNQGYVGEEIAELIKLPENLENLWSGRGYYGTLRHNARAVYQRYMGWYDGNPSSLNILPPVETAKKYVEYMGGERKILKRAKKDFKKGEYRWLAMALKHVVFANENNKAAKELLADTYEQLGYQAESGPWRSVYLQGAYELRNGLPKIPGDSTASPDTIRAMDPNLLFDFMAVRLNAEKAKDKNITMNVNFTDLNEEYAITVNNSVMNYSKKLAKNPNVTITLNKPVFMQVQLKEATWADKIKSGEIKLTGNAKTLDEFNALFDDFNLWFNVVTP